MGVQMAQMHHLGNTNDAGEVLRSYNGRKHKGSKVFFANGMSRH